MHADMHAYMHACIQRKKIHIVDDFIIFDAPPLNIGFFLAIVNEWYKINERASIQWILLHLSD